MRLAAMLPWVAAGASALATAVHAAAVPAGHRVDIDLRGPLALVTIERALPPDPDAGREERVLDLDLPDGAALVSVELAGRAPRLTGAPAADDAYRRRLEALGLIPTRRAWDEGADVRIRVASRAPGLLVRYRFAAPLGCRDGRFNLRMPGTLEADPQPAEVTVRAAAAVRELDVAGVPARPGSRQVRLRAPARAAWELSFRAGAGEVGALAARGDGGGALGVCRAPTGSGGKGALPERVVLAIDRSRSVGLAGLGAERELALRLVEALPPSLRFNAVLFDRAAKPLFPISRQATQQALSALEAALGPGELRNGTDLAGAIRRAADLLREEQPGRGWLVVVTDGAVPDAAAATPLEEALERAPRGTRVAVLVVRPRGDEPPPPQALEALGALPALRGGVLRVVDPALVGETVADVVAAMAGAGDLFAVGAAGLALGHVAPGAGLTRVGRLPAAGLGSIRARRAGATESLAVVAARVGGGWLQALLEPRPLPWVAAGGGDALLVSSPPQAPAAEPAVARGEMDRAVVRNALSLAFLPRARACYLSRPVRQAGDVELRGRVRLELHVERGELVDAQVRSSTLARPEIEACVREAAYEVEMPRPLHRDAPTVAALNLVFQPRTPGGQPDASALSREIDLLLGPVSFDPHELLRSE